MNRTDRIPLSPRRPSLSGRFLCPHAAIFGFHSHACSPCVELIGPASRPRDFFPRRVMANALYPRLIALNSARRIHPRHTSHKKWGTLGVKVADYAKAARVFSYQWDFEIKSFKQEQVSLLVPDKTLEEIKKRAEDLEVWIDRRPKWNGGTVYRGVPLSRIQRNVLTDSLPS